MSTEDEKPLSGEAERARLKAEHLRELKARKQLLDQAPSQHYLSNALKALEEMTSFSDDTDDWVARLNGKSLLQEAKLDMALDPQAPAQPEVPANADTAPASSEDLRLSPPDKTLGDEQR
jgi:hypothetical protein